MLFWISYIICLLIMWVGIRFIIRELSKDADFLTLGDMTCIVLIVFWSLVPYANILGAIAVLAIFLTEYKDVPIIRINKGGEN